MKLKLLLIFLGLFGLFSCTKDEDITEDMEARLSFSVDSVLFDTVFTSVGSATRRLKIYNHHAKAIQINHIRLSGGAPSPFHLNINGQATSELNSLKINGRDSINVFIKVNINPTLAHSPFIVQDSIQFYYNGQQQQVALIAYGQNAQFMVNEVIQEDRSWNSPLPYLIYKSLTIDEGKTLTIEAGTKVLFHRNATMNVKGTLLVKGTKEDSVVFSGDRLEKMYAEESGQWNGIHFYPQSSDSKIDYALIKNGVAGITVDSLSATAQPKLLLTNSIIKNMEVVGFLGYHTQLTAFNNLFFNCGQYLLYGVGGGRYDLKQNTFAGVNFQHVRKTSALYLSDFISHTQSDDLKVDIQNNIVWGPLSDEFSIDKKSATTAYTSTIKNNLLKTTDHSYQLHQNLLNQDPLFNSSKNGDFSLGESSPALKKGASLTNDPYYLSFLRRDQQNRERLFPSDLGCYERN